MFVESLSTPNDGIRNVVIIGGGFAGSTLARRLKHRLPAGYRLVLLSEESYTTFHPMLAEVVGATIFPEQIVAPLRQVLRPSDKARFIMGRVTRIDFAAKTIRCDSLAGEIMIPFAHAVLAFGNIPRLDLVPGLSEFALPLKTIGDAMEIRNTVLRRVARIELEHEPALRAALGHVVVIGGGFSGVEAAGELADSLNSIRKYYPLVDPNELKVTLVHDQNTLLPEMPNMLGRVALKSLERLGVNVRVGVRAARACEDRLLLADGEALVARTIVATAGTRAHPLAIECGLPLERGRIVVEPDMSIAAAEGAWAIGDCAFLRNAVDGNPSPPTAQFAVRQGEQLAANLLKAIAGRRTQPFRYRSRGMLATVGRLNGVAVVFGFAVTGLPAWLLWRAYYLAQMPTLGRKLRIFVEWTWSMLFSSDITHFRFSRSGPTKETP